MLLDPVVHRFFDWVFAVAKDEPPYKWKLDATKKTTFYRTKFRCNSDESNIYKKKAEDAFEESLKVISLSGWQKEKICGEDVIYSQNLPKYGKTFKYEGFVNIPPQTLNSRLFNDVEKSPQWNNAIKKAKVLKSVDKNVNIAQIISTSAPLVKSREFISLRAWKRYENAFVHSSVTIDLPDVPETNQYIRAEQRFCTYVIKPVPGNPNRSHVVWLMHTNLKGWLPQYITDQAIAGSMMLHVSSIRSFERK